MILSHVRRHDQATTASLSLAAVSRNAVALAAITGALAIGASLAYLVLTGAPDAPLNPATVLVLVEAVSLVVLTAILALLYLCRAPVIQAAQSIFKRGVAPLVIATLAVGIAITVATPLHEEGAAILILAFILLQTAVLRASVVRATGSIGSVLFAAPLDQEGVHAEVLDLVALMQRLARGLVSGTDLEACRLFTVSSDRGALVLRGEAHSAATATASGRPPRERLPVEQLPWLERLLQRDGWLHVPSEIVATDGIGHELTRSLTPAGMCGDLSLRALRVDGNPVGVICLIHRRGTSAAARTRRQRTTDVAMGAAQTAIERALRRRSLEINAGGWLAMTRELPYGVVIVNRGTRVVACNAAVESALSTQSAEVLGRRLCDGSFACSCPLHLTLRTGESRQVPLRTVWSLSLSPSTAGQLVNIWATDDASEASEFAVIALSATAGRDTTPRIGTEVAAMISHELRAPLATLRASSELALEEMDDPEQQRRLLSTISRQVDRLDLLVQDLADVFRLQAGQLQLNREVLDVPELCQELIDDLRELGTRHSITVHADESVRAVAADRLKIRTVLNNLVGNATKYAPEDTPITVTVLDTDDGLDVSVVDQGPGIAEGDLPHVFEQFYRSASARTAAKGYGLGLYITRSLVELHGGSIWAESDAGRGSRFTFRLPQRVDKVPAARQQAG